MITIIHTKPEWTKSGILAHAKTIYQQNFGNEYFWYPKVFTAGLTEERLIDCCITTTASGVGFSGATNRLNV